jgi:hypothetical protein
VANPRRYHLRARRTAEFEQSPGLASAHYGRQLAEPGAPLPSNFPCLSKLNAAGYHAFEDFGLDVPNTVDLEELQREAGLSLPEARAVLASLELL